jgi:hypothetical protein
MFLKALACGLATVLVATTCLAQAPMSEVQRRTMTDDPQVNLVLKTYTSRLDDPAQTVVRTLRLAKLLGEGCQGAQIDKSRFNDYLRQAHFEDLPAEHIENAAAIVAPAFSYIDTDKLDHLCAGIPYFFGHRGVLARELVSPGDGRALFGSKRLYFRAPSLFGPE